MTRTGPPEGTPSISRKMLVVDDDPGELKGIIVALQMAGYDALGETQVIKALQLAQELRPELMVIDWKMPGATYDGLELLFNVRKDPDLRGVPVILLVYGCAWYKPE